MNNTIEELHNAYTARELSPVEVTKEYLARIEKYNRTLNAYTTHSPEIALAQAGEAERSFLRGEQMSPLAGIPFGIKDVIYTKDFVTSMGCSAFADFVPGEDAAVVEKLKAAKSVTLGKTTAHQLSFGITGDRSHTGAPRNPYDTSRITGGSSGGSACAVAADLCTAALGTDTGGSCRIPAFCCGIVGMKPTAGLISRYGAYPYSHTLDCMGMLTKTVTDSILMLNALAGYDERDGGTRKAEFCVSPDVANGGVDGMTIGVPENWEESVLDADIRDGFSNAIKSLAKMRAKIRYVHIPDLSAWRAARRAISMHEAYEANRELIEQKPDTLDSEILSRFSNFSYDRAGYRSALAQIPASQTFFSDLFSGCQAAITPTSPVLPTEINQRTIRMDDKEYGCIDLLTKFMWQCNMAGFPAMSIPIGLSKTGLPIGLQIMGRELQESTIYQVAANVEKEFGHVRPDLALLS